MIHEPTLSMRTDRRTLLRSAGVLLGAGLSPLRALALEDEPAAAARRPTLVVLFLRGGLDGLNLLVPHGEAAYYALRPGLAIRRPGEAGGALDLDGSFGLHPAAAALHPFFAAGRAVALPAVGHARNTRSHFEEQDRWETAVDEVLPSSAGWLNRHLATSRGRGPIRALALGGALPRSLRGDEQALALRGLDDLSFPGAADGLASTVAALESAYGRTGEAGARDLLARGGQASLEALAQLAAVARAPRTSAVEYPNTDLGRRCREAAKLVRADLGVEVLELDLGGWDTHQNQGREAGPYADRVRQVADALAAFLGDLGEHSEDVLVVTMTEFGRTAAQNGTNGTDHGWASVSLALGAPVARANVGEPVLGRWPGLEAEQLNQARDLAFTTDYRDLYAELLRFLGNERVEEVLPGHAPTPVGLVV